MTTVGLTRVVLRKGVVNSSQSGGKDTWVVERETAPQTSRQQESA